MTEPSATSSASPVAPVVIESVPARLVVLRGHGVQQYDRPKEIQIGPPTLFALVPIAPVARRYLYLIQQQTDPRTALIVLMVVGDTREGGGARVPPQGAWQRAVVKGTVHLLASDQQLTLKQIVAYRQGHEPPPTPTQPPFI
jgi:hypothetical protein